MGKLDVLAAKGGKPVTTEKYPPWPWFSEEIVQSVLEPLRTGRINYWTGDLGMKFEQQFAEWCGAKYGIATSNGTAALHVALVSLGVGPGDEVIVPSYTFIASSFSVVQAGAVPVFADVIRNGHNIDPEDIERKITEKTKAIVCVHLYGEVCDMDAIMAIANKHNLKVVEDCAQAHGASIRGKKVGTFGHMGAFSFCQSKTFTTGGEGGAVVTNDENAAWIARSFRDHGYDVAERMRLLELEAKLPYIHNMVGFNYRMTEMQSAIGLKEMERLDNWNLANRRRNGQILLDALQDVPNIIKLPTHNETVKNGFWMFPVVVDIDKMDCDINTLWHAIADEGVPCGPVMWPQCYKENAYQKHQGLGGNSFPFSYPGNRPGAADYSKTFCKNAAEVEERCFFVPTHPTYEPKHMEWIAEAIKKVMAAYAK